MKVHGAAQSFGRGDARPHVRRAPGARDSSYASAERWREMREAVMKQREVAEGGRGLPSPGRGGSFSLLTFRCRATAAPAQPPARGTISVEGWSRDRGRGRRGLWKLILAASTGSLRSVHWLWRQFRRISARSRRTARSGAVCVIATSAALICREERRRTSCVCAWCSLCTRRYSSRECAARCVA